MDRILEDLLGRDFDLRSETGRDAAIEAIGSRDPATDSSGRDAKVDAETKVDLPENTSLSAWKAARSLCAAVQINFAITWLDALVPLPDKDADPLDGEVPGDFAAIRTQVRDQLRALRDEYANDNDGEVLENIHGTLFAGDEPLFDRLREAGNLVAAHVNDRAAERQVTHYLAIRATTAMLCGFALSCKKPATEPKGESGVGAAIATTERALQCARDTGTRLVEELGTLGLAANCTSDTIPGVRFRSDPSYRSAGATKSSRAKADESAHGRTDSEVDGEVPHTDQLFLLLRRVDAEVGNWLGTLDRDGKRGARVIRSEVDRLATKAQRYRPKAPSEGEEWSRTARLLSLFVAELDRAAHELGRLLDN